MRKIERRGHAIGLHPSYGSYMNSSIIFEEAEVLKKICFEENISQDTWGARMHFLRWKYPITLRALAKANMDYDSTVSYADYAGFRCGTCFDFPAFDAVEDRTLDLRIRPLIAMEHTIIAKNYMGLGLGAPAYEKFLQLKNACKSVNGTFTLLWHNNQLATEAERNLYISVIK